MISLLFIAGLMAAFSCPATADQLEIKEADQTSSDRRRNLYVTAGAGANWPIDRVGTGDAGSFTEFSNPGFSTEIGLGYNFKPLRLELTYALDATNLRGYDSVSGQYFKYTQGGETRKNSAFASLYWDLLPNKRLSPYVGAGIGLSVLNVDTFSEPGYQYDGYSRSLLGYQAKLGISYAMNPRSKAFIEAVYRGTSGYNTFDGYNDWSNPNFSSWGTQLGLRIGL